MHIRKFHCMQAPYLLTGLLQYVTRYATTTPDGSFPKLYLFCGVLFIVSRAFRRTKTLWAKPYLVFRLSLTFTNRGYIGLLCGT